MSRNIEFDEYNCAYVRVDPNDNGSDQKAKVAESVNFEDANIVLDFDEKGTLLGIEIMID